MTDDVRAALDDLFRLPNWENRLGPWADVNGAVKRLHDAYSALPADDGELLTGDWLRAVGFGDAMNPAWVWAKGEACYLAANVPRLGVWKVVDQDDPDAMHTCDVQVPTPRTRGDVRRLARALGCR